MERKPESSLSSVWPILKCVLLTLAVAALRFSLNFLLGNGSPFMFFFPTVMFAAFRWGRGPGLVSVAASAVCVALFWLPPRWELTTTANGVVLHLLLFCVIAAVATHFICHFSTVTRQFSVNAQRYQSLVRSTGGFVWIADTKGISQAKPDQWEEVTGRTTYKVGDWAAMIEPDDLKAVVSTFNAASQEKKSYETEFRMISKNGSYRWFSTRAVPILDQAGELSEWVGVTHDVHNIKMAERALLESERRIRLAVELARLAVYHWTPLTGELYWDSRMKAMWGLQKDAFVDVSVFRAGIHPHDLPLVEERMRQSISPGGNGIFDAEFRVIGIEDKIQRWVAARGQTAFVDGKPTAHVGASLDITDRKRAEEKLESAVKERTAELRMTIAELEAFSYSISHDLRSPLRAMHSFAVLLSEECSDRLTDDGRDYLRRIMNGSRRMDNLVLDVLSYSKVALTELPVNRVNVSSLLADILESYPQYQDVREKISVAKSFPAVIGNEAGLTQCLSNLIDNAMKFAPAGNDIRIVIGSEEIGDRVRITVQDNGIGIEQNQQEKIFGIFQRVSKGYEGTGIGLAIVRKAAERMGGSVGLTSEFGKGSTFWIELKRASEVAAPSRPVVSGQLGA